MSHDITITNPFSGATVERDISGLSEDQLAAYPLDEAICNALSLKMAPCTPAEFLAAYVAQVGADDAGIVILGS